MTMPMDLDELLALEKKRDAERLLWAEAVVAFRTDHEIMIDIAKAAASAAEAHARQQGEERLAADPTTDPSVAEQLRAGIRYREKQRRTAEAALARAEAFAAFRGL